MTQQTLLKNWHLMRWLRLGLGIFIAVQAIQTHHALSGLIAAFFLFQAATNTGCCGSYGCTVERKKSDANKIENTEFEELKIK